MKTKSPKQTNFLSLPSQCLQGEGGGSLKGKTVEELWKVFWHGFVLLVPGVPKQLPPKPDTVGSLWPHPSWCCTTVPEWQRKLILEGKLKKLHLKCFKTEIMNICVSKNNIKNLSLAKALLEEGGKRACTCSGGHLEVLRMRSEELVLLFYKWFRAWVLS